MPEEKKQILTHSVVMDRRSTTTVTGVVDVISFDEETIITETQMGVMVLRGSDLHVNRLNLEKGDMEIDGEIISLTYEEQAHGVKGKGSFLGNLFK